MTFDRQKLKQEAIDSALSQINYYINMPRHIKEAACKISETGLGNVAIKQIDENIKKEQEARSNIINSPAHVVSGEITVTGGKLNIPSVSHAMQFLKKSISGMF